MPRIRFPFETPYINTISAEHQPEYPGDEVLEQKIRSLIRWNAMAMVIRANHHSPGIGGHLSSYASSANIYEVAFNHFFKGHDGDQDGDQIFIQGHSAPGIYARAYLEGRLTEAHLENFRRELQTTPGLSSYPHPWLMPDFWEFPTVSMGLGPLQAIYQARFNRYLRDRGIKNTDNSRVWAFMGDGEMDEPESMGSITVASREGLDNLTFVVNCNLQRLDGPVRGNGKIIQELESIFRGAGWNVIKVIWGRDWDPLLLQDAHGELMNRMSEVVDGEYQKYCVEPGSYTREHFFGKSPELLKIASPLTDDQIRKLGRGGHDSQKLYAAFKAATLHKGQPTLILAKTIKGYGLGEGSEAKNITHQQKKMNEQELKLFRDRFNIPIADKDLKDAPFYRPTDTSEEIQYLKARREALQGFVPKRRRVKPNLLQTFDYSEFKEFFEATAPGREVATTMVFAAFFSKLLRHPKLGKSLVPVIPDEARTFGMDPLFKQVGIYSSLGQLYEPVDSKMLFSYRETKEGQVLEEGITEAGAIASFIASGISESTFQLPTIPFFIFYSMFGFQRIGDLIWSLQDSRARGFILGATAGRTTLAGEGLQHQDGHSHLFASAYPRIKSYEPAFAYEVLILFREGIREMYEEGKEIAYYITLQNEKYAMPKIPENLDETVQGVLKGMYRITTSTPTQPINTQTPLHLLGSGSILQQVIAAQKILEERFQIVSSVWSVTSFTELRRDAHDCEHWNRFHPEEPAKTSYLSTCLNDPTSLIIAATDNVKLVPDQISPWIPNLISLGTDGFGRSESREDLRRFFGVDAESIVATVLESYVKKGIVTKEAYVQYLKESNLMNKTNPLTL